MMVKKRNTKHTHVTDLEVMNNYLNSENHNLRKKNEDLAKALSESRLEFQKVVQINTELNGRLHTVEVERLKCHECFKSLGSHMELYIKQLINLTEQMTHSCEKANIFSNPDILRQYINMSSSYESLNQSHNKTMAVMPMVDGHTILSPKINLPRVSVKQLTHMMHNSSNERVSANDIEADEIEFADNVSINNESISENSSYSGEQPNRRLETMQEDEDEDEDVSSSSQPLLSGIFKDVKVYISPLRSQHIIQFKNKPPSRKHNHKNLSRNINDSSMENSSYNSSAAEDINLTQRNDQTSEMHVYSTVDTSKQVDMKETSNSTSVNTEISHEYDPLEGTSSSTYNCVPNETSTPLYHNEQKKEFHIDLDADRTPTRPSSNFTQRKRGTCSVSTGMSNCSVKIRRISSNTLKSLSTRSSLSESARTSSRERAASPTVLEKSRRSGSFKKAENTREKALETKSSASPVKRQRRNRKQISYAEPSLHKKLRR